MWLLIERGAEWKNEQEFGQSLQQMLEYGFQYQRGISGEAPVEMELLRKKLAELNQNPER